MMAEDKEQGMLRVADENDIDLLIYHVPNSSHAFDVQPAIWLTDYLLTVVGLALAAHLIVEAPEANVPTIALVLYYISFAFTWLVGGMAHHFCYIAIQTNLRVREDALKVATGERKLARLRKGIILVWKVAASVNIVTAAAALVVFYWLSFPAEPAEIASIVTAALGGLLALALLLVEGLRFKYFIPLTVISLICFGVGCGIVQVYEGVGYAVLSLVVAAQQQMKWGLSEEYFNHNAVFHTIILLAGYPLLHIASLKVVQIAF